MLAKMFCENKFRNDVYLYENLSWLRHWYRNFLVSVILYKQQKLLRLALG
jgi:hypothetical protein